MKSIKFPKEIEKLKIEEAAKILAYQYFYKKVFVLTIICLSLCGLVSLINDNAAQKLGQYIIIGMYITFIGLFFIFSSITIRSSYITDECTIQYVKYLDTINYIWNKKITEAPIIPKNAIIIKSWTNGKDDLV